MTAAKIAVSLPERVLAGARNAVKKGHASSMSAYVALALEQKILGDELGDLLKEMLAETGGALTMAERRAADRAILGPKIARKKR